MMRNNKFNRLKRKRNDAMDLEGKVAAAGGAQVFGLEPDEDNHETMNKNIHDGRNRFRKSRTFRAISSKNVSQSQQSGGAASASSRSRKNPYTRFRRTQRSSRSTTSSLVTGSFSERSNAGYSKAAVHIVCAIGENKARETCVASLNAGAPVSLEVAKQSNGQTYAQTIAYLQMLNPDEVLLNEGRRHSQLAQNVIQLFGGDQSVVGTWGLKSDIVVHSDIAAPGRSQMDGSQSVAGSTSGACKTSTVVKFISRACFDQTRGADLLRKVAQEETFDVSLVSDYIVASSSFAVLNYAQHCLGVTIARKCMYISLNSGRNNRMAIDLTTLQQLEIIVNAKTGRGKNSLMATIDHTCTTVGRRLLRTSLMSPPCRRDTINARLDLVDILMSEEEFFYTVLEHLKSLPDLEKVLAQVAVIPKTTRTIISGARDRTGNPVRLASKGISALVCIKSTLSVLPAFAAILEDHMETLDSQGGGLANEAVSQSEEISEPLTVNASLLVGLGNGPIENGPLKEHHLLKAIIRAMRQPALTEILQAVTDIFTASTTFSRNQHTMRHQECFALKAPEKGMMEILRKAYLANVDDIYQKADEYAEIYGFYVKVRYSANRGYYLSLPADIASTLPPIFIQPSKTANVINCTTEEVASLNTRAQDNVTDLLLMTNDNIAEVLEVARSKYDALASMSDAISLLDLCHSFASIVSESKLPWCRPILSEQSSSHDESGSSALTILKGRYGIDVSDLWLSANGPENYVPNDTYISQKNPFTVISGVNGSGKSTYLKQVAIIVLLAHCGSYVPAEQASIPVSIRLLISYPTHSLTHVFSLKN